MPGHSLAPLTLGPPFPDGLLSSTRSTLKDLHDNGKLSYDQLRLLSYLLDEARAAAGDGDGRPADDDDVSGWADMPELAAAQIFGSGSNEDLHHRYPKIRMLGSARLVCRSWRRAISRHCTAGNVNLEVRHSVPHWAARVRHVLPEARDLQLDFGHADYSEADKDTGAGAIAAAVPHLERLELRNWWVSSTDIGRIARDLTALRELRLSTYPNVDEEVNYNPDCNEVLDIIGGMTTLEILALRFQSACDEKSWLALGALTRLTELHIRQHCPSIRGALPYLMSRLSELKQLTLGTAITAVAPETLSQLSSISLLSTKSPGHLVALAPYLASLPSLRELRLGSHFVARTSSSLKPAGAPFDSASAVKAPHVQQLDVTNINLVGRRNCLQGLAALLPGLVEITLKSVTVPLAHLSGLSSLQHLVKLKTCCCDLTGPMAKTGLQCLSRVRDLCLCNSVSVTEQLSGPKGLALLLPPSLQTLRVYFSHGTYDVEDVALALRPLRDVHYVNLSGIRMTRKGPEGDEAEDVSRDAATAYLKATLPLIDFRINLNEVEV